MCMHYSHERYYQRTSLINKKNANPSLLTHPLTFPLSLISILLSSSLRITFFRFSYKQARTKFVLAIAQLFNILQTPSVVSLVTGLEHYWTVKESSRGWLGGRKAYHWGSTLERSVGTHPLLSFSTSWSPCMEQAAIHVFLSWHTVLSHLESTKPNVNTKWNFWNHEMKLIFSPLMLNISGNLSHYEKLNTTIFLCMNYFIYHDGFPAF